MCSCLPFSISSLLFSVWLRSIYPPASIYLSNTGSSEFFNLFSLIKGGSQWLINALPTVSYIRNPTGQFSNLLGYFSLVIVTPSKTESFRIASELLGCFHRTLQSNYTRLKFQAAVSKSPSRWQEHYFVVVTIDVKTVADVCIEFQRPETLSYPELSKRKYRTCAYNTNCFLVKNDKFNAQPTVICVSMICLMYTSKIMKSEIRRYADISWSRHCTCTLAHYLITP